MLHQAIPKKDVLQPPPRLPFSKPPCVLTRTEPLNGGRTSGLAAAARRHLLSPCSDLAGQSKHAQRSVPRASDRAAPGGPGGPGGPRTLRLPRIWVLWMFRVLLVLRHRLLRLEFWMEALSCLVLPLLLLSLLAVTQVEAVAGAVVEEVATDSR